MLEKLLEIGRIYEKLFFKIDELVKDGIALSCIIDCVDLYFEKNGIDIIENSEYITINVNNTVYHGLQTLYELKDGDIVTIDVCFSVGGQCIDGAKTYTIGSVSKKIKDLVYVNKLAIKEVVKLLEPGIKLYTLLMFLSDFIGLRGFYLYPDGIGHGIGEMLHKKPFMSLGNMEDMDYIFKKGDVFTLEPLVFLFNECVVENDLGEGMISSKNLSSQFEVTIYLDEGGHAHLLNGALIK